ncbi:MAG TPA: response regulator transcription factor [Candidatus Krumholzibacterium sp.]|nr:response regulator transcription factor [Candidatus Krumholzibacterium sp.]
MNNNVRLMLVDDHNVVREAFKKLLEVEGFRIVGEAADGHEAIRMAADLVPDLIVMDISIPKLRGIETTRRIKKEVPAVKVVMLTIHNNETFLYQSLDAGAEGYLVKDADSKELVKAIHTILGGEVYIGENFPPDILENYSKFKKKGKSGDQFSRLTRREREILQHIAEGSTSQKIANELFISKKTVENHRANIMNKLDIHDTASLVLYAVRIGLVDGMS